MTKPFKIESAHINRLNDIQLTQLLNELLQAEAYKFGLAQRVVEVALNIRVGDGGEDGRIHWNGGPEQTDYIPNRLTMFQNKATKMAPAAYADEIVTNARSGIPSAIKPKVEEVLDHGGAYIVFTTQELNAQKKNTRITAIRGKLREHGKGYADTCQIEIYDASQIAGWVNKFISTIVSVQHWIGTPVERGLKTFSLWEKHEELSNPPFVSVESRKHILESLAGKIEEPRSCFRITGLSGLGKTRTAFQVFKDNESLRSLVVYVDANHAPNIDALVSDWVGLGLKSIVVVDNCEYHLHERLVKEVRRQDSQISLLTLDYNFESVSNLSVCFRLGPMTDEELMLLLTPVYKDQLPDLDRVVAFAQGFPQMAVLLAQARLSEDPRIGELTEDDLANKLLWRRGEEENSAIIKILQACSLFDVFGVEREMEGQLKFIADVIGIDIDQVYGCVHDYSERGIIDRRGRFGQVVPKPLAIRLAGQWWARSREEKQRELVDQIPENMIEGFCHQVEKLDFHSNVKKLTEKLCGPQGPFGQAEVILSDRGSRLFRSFVVVNPESTCEALYKTLENLNLYQLQAIDGDARRNLVWGLERLCFYSEIFQEAAWCMLLLASAENEDWSNNATGMFSQLFRVNLSGTAAIPESRFNLIRRALELNSPNIDMVLLKALGNAIDTFGGHRTIGAEYQGSKPPLEEWRPQVWQEIFDYWQQCFSFLLILFERGEAQKESVLSTIGHSIRGFVSIGRIDMLNSAIRHIVSSNGRYWPAALESIKNAFNFDSNGMRQEAKEALNSWLDLLSPKGADLAEKLKIVVINPPWEHRDSDGGYVDVAAEKAKSLAVEVSKNINDLVPYLDLLFQGEQKQSYSFGYQLAIELEDIIPLVDLSFDRFFLINQPNPSFLFGLYRGVYEKSPKMWYDLIDNLLNDSQRVHLYSGFIRTGNIQEKHLQNLLELIRSKVIPLDSANALCYGRVTENITPCVMSEFCLSLAALGDETSWSALEVIYMYCHGNKDYVDLLRDVLKKLVSSVSLHKISGRSTADMYKWSDLAKKILEIHDQEFAVALSNQMISSAKYDLNYSDLSIYIKPLLLQLMREYGEVLWPLFGDAIVKSEGMARYWFKQLLDREDSFSIKSPSVISAVAVEHIIAWCEQNPDVGPSFIAGSMNILEAVENELRPSALFVGLLEKFGNDQRVTSSLSANMGTRGWSGSLVPYLEADKVALAPLIGYENRNVSRWVREHIAYIDRQIEYESIRDQERDIGLF